MGRGLFLLKKRLVLVHEVNEVRDSILISIKSSIPNATVVRSCAVYEEAVKLYKKDMADLFVLHFNEITSHTVEIIDSLKEKRNSANFFLICKNYEQSIVFDLLRKRVVGVCDYNQDGLLRMVEGLKVVFDGGAYFSPDIARVIAESFWLNSVSPLTDRESEVLRLMMLGKTYSEVAGQLYISKETSKTHIRNIYKKLNVKSRSGAVKRAMEDRLVGI